MTAEFCAVLGLSFKNNGMGPLNQQMEMRHGPFASMDDFDYSVHIAERDWSTFLQECDECDVLQGTLASLDDSGKMGCLLLRKQSDVCLVCIAFASWLLRSAEPQNVDTWRNVLLANVSAACAIRYLRTFIRDDTAIDKL
ncbi:uncharacterized protein perm1b [Paramormyrops kingsleyae]|uniref:uncharacterized protein perm1b n=1 Tax=Paramormyrops kingsleyae TaxID=1676925 RepID=UPI000CD5E6E3|nr:PGC-1 and ERR-induced regulator in muscle protein 1 isoform X2 [Paramormyrops kingsleyae]